MDLSKERFSMGGCSLDRFARTCSHLSLSRSGCLSSLVVEFSCVTKIKDFLRTYILLLKCAVNQIGRIFKTLPDLIVAGVRQTLWNLGTGLDWPRFSVFG